MEACIYRAAHSTESLTAMSSMVKHGARREALSELQFSGVNQEVGRAGLLSRGNARVKIWKLLRILELSGR